MITSKTTKGRGITPSLDYKSQSQKSSNAPDSCPFPRYAGSLAGDLFDHSLDLELFRVQVFARERDHGANALGRFEVIIGFLNEKRLTDRHVIKRIFSARTAT